MLLYQHRNDHNLGVPGPISQNGNFYSNCVSSPKIYLFQISFKLVQLLDTRRDCVFCNYLEPYTLLCKLYIILIMSHFH